MKRWLVGLLTLMVVLTVTPMSFAQEDLELPELYEKVSPSVVFIEVRAQQGDFLFPTDGLGSGFVYDSDGHIVTNYHVVQDAEAINVTFFDGTLARAVVVGLDADSDLAVIQVKDVPQERLIPAVLGDSGVVQIGEEVVAIGNPFGQTWTMTRGIISALGRANRAETGFSIPQMIQTDAAINPGNSGGPLVNHAGEVIGVNTMIFSEEGRSAGVGFAVPSNTVRRVIPELIANGRYEYTWIGISGGDLSLDLIELLELDRDTRGVLVGRVSDNSPAEEAGLRGSDKRAEINGLTYQIGGDIITALDDTPVTGINDLIAFLAENTRPGDQITVTLIRGNEVLQVPVTLEARPDQAR